MSKHIRGRHEHPEYVHPYYSANPGEHRRNDPTRALSKRERRIAWAQIALNRGVGRLLSKGGAA